MGKVCTQCKIYKEFEDYAIDKQMNDNHRSNCKACGRLQCKRYRDSHKEQESAYNKKYREANKESISILRKRHYKNNQEYAIAYAKEYERLYPEKVKESRLKHRDKRLRWHREYKKNNQDKVKAHGAVGTAISNGTLVRPDTCSSCNKKGVIHAHHESYKEKDWLKVIWLCRSCHMRLHGIASRN